MNCSKCNAWVPEDSAFCPECGQKIEAPAPVEETPAQTFCPNCGNAMAAGDAFCENCGANMSAAPEAVPAEEPVAEPAPAPAADVTQTVKNAVSKLNIPPKFLKLGAAAVAVILVVVILISLFSGTKAPNYALYIKDGEMVYSEMPKGKNPVEITSKLIDESGIDNEDFLDATYLFAYLTRISEDGSKIFYPDKIDDDGYTLYCRDLSKLDKEPVKIDSGLSSYYYYLNEKGTLVTYLKDGKLYQHNLTEKTKIEDDVDEFRVSDDGKTLLYLVWEDDEEAGTLYLKKGNKEAEKIASDVTDLTWVSEDFKTYMYRKEDSLYKQTGTKDAEKIASDVESVLHIYEDGTFYFSTCEEEHISYWDLFTDDLQDGYGEYYKEWMKESYVSYPFSTLNYYDGKEVNVVCESMIDWEDYAADQAVIVYTAAESADLPKWKLSEFADSYFDIYSRLEEYVSEGQTYYIAAEEVVGEMGLEDVRRIYLSADGKTLYVGADYDSEEYIMTLYQLDLNGAKVKKSEKIDEDVYPSYVDIYEDGVTYFKDVDDGEGELYLNGKHIDDDVYVRDVSYADGNLYYFVDWDEDDYRGTLRTSNGKKAETIKDDVFDFVLTPDGEVLFLYDYDTDDCRGELWILNGKKATKLDEDVIALIPVY